MTMHHTRASNVAGRHGFWHSLSSIKLSQLICVLAVIMIVIPLVTHYYISNMGADGDGTGSSHKTRRQLDHDEISSSKVTDLRFQIEELKSIKASVLHELRELESRRQKLHSEITGYNTHIEQLKSTYEKTYVELEQLKITIESSRLEQEELIKRTMPEVRAPHRILPGLDDGVYIPPPTSHVRCRMHSCFDYSRCSLTSQFPVYLYNPDEYSFSQPQLESFIKLSVRHAFDTSPHITIDPNIACVYIVLIGDVEGGLRNTTSLEKKLHNLPYWHGDGRNHVLLNIARYYSNLDVFEDVNIGRAMIVQSGFTDTTFRDKFDIVIPPSIGISHGDVWEQLRPVSPARRKHLLSFQGEFSVALDKFKLSGAELLQIDGMQGHVENWDAPLAQPGVQQQRLKTPSQDMDKGRINKRKAAGGKGGNINLDLGVQVDKKLHEEREEHYEQEEDDEGDPIGPGDHDVFDRDQQLADARKDHPADVEGGEEEKHQFRQLKAKNDSNVRVRPRAGGKLRHRAATTTQRQRVEQLLSQEASIVQTLKRMQGLFPSDGFHFEFQCHGECITGINGEWALCGPDTLRHATLEQSTFSLLIAPTNSSVVSTVLTQVRFYEALKYGSIPVVLGEYTNLPFAELFAWKRAAIILPKARVTELHLFIRSVSDGDILEMRRQGRILWEKYSGTTHSIVNTMLAVLRTRLHIPAYPVREEPAPSVFNSSFIPLREDVPESMIQSEDVLGPIESPLPSLRYHRNFTQLEDPFALPSDPFHSYPFTPFEPLMPGEAKFMGSGLGFRPIGKGAGGAGKEFSEALGGNLPREQFTIVILTYEREAVLLNALSRLKGLPHLNKVLVVWNNPRPPADELRWPNIGVNIHVVRTAKNSLNNRFLPYDAIETEAILSIDDDAHLRHDEIMFGFRVWRENRERVVGFPGRFHSWDLQQPGWLYNSNYSCELSMVLTGAAFFHKYYAYLYTNVMPQAIRDKVDEYLNCEDIAMNFLVAHITRKPPIKVTSRWTFRCPGCSNALSVEDSHFNERHKCINFFTKVYGYMPLLYTQYRVDSVLFKTRIPHDRQKCFKFI